MTDKPATPSIETLPILAGFSGRGSERFGRALASLAGYLDAGSVPNARYEELRPAMLDQLEQGWKGEVTQPLWAIAATGRDNHDVYKEGTLPYRARQVDHELSFSSYEGVPGVRRLAKKFEKARAAAHPGPIAEILAGADAVMAEIRLVADAMAWLQERRVKRAPPGSAPPEPELPRATREAQAAVSNRMREVLGDLRAAFSDRVVEMVRRQAEAMERTCRENRVKAGEGRDGRDREMRQRVIRAAELRYIGKHLSDYDPNTYAVTRHEDGEARARKYADGETERVFHLWTARNVAKLSPIVEAKGGVTIDVIRARASSNGVETLMAVSFPDGSRFNFSNAIEYACSTQGKEFARFPARFHDAFRADGTRIRGASEARVVLEFVPASPEEPEGEAAPSGPRR